MKNIDRIKRLKTSDYNVHFLQKVNETYYNDIIKKIDILAIHYESLTFKSNTDKKVIEVLTAFIDYLEAQAIIIAKLTADNQFHYTSFMDQIDYNNVAESIFNEKIKQLTKNE